jgi:N-acetylglucosaminyl-diphospho-decaprenol L-rhamnosyltransferase
MNKVWVVIVTYNGAKWINRCLESIKCSSINAKVIIVDNDSKDDTQSIITTKFPLYTLIQNKKNVGFGEANNIGIRYALQNGADYVALLNQDAWLHENALELLLTTSEKYSEYGILSPMFYSYDGNSLDPFLVKYIYPTNIKLASDVFFQGGQDVYEVGLMPAAMWFLKKEAVIEVGGFDPLFFMYGEDNDLWERFKFRSWKVGIATKPVVYHYYPSTENYHLHKMIWKAYAKNVLMLKSAKNSFLHNCIGLLRKYVAESFDLFIYFKFKELYVLNKSYGQTLINISRIKKHRNISERCKGAFLNVGY